MHLNTASQSHRFLPYGRQCIDDADIAEVVRVLRSDFVTCGPEVEAFEDEFAAMLGAKHAIAVSNATAALHLAVMVAGVAAGERVVTSPNTFLASANAAAYVGAIPDFCDIDAVSYNLDPEALERTWQPGTKAVVAVDYAGQSADLPRIAEIARARGAVVIEDACHGTGGGFEHAGKVWKLGAHPWADLSVFSFHPLKAMTTGEGGMLVTDDAGYARQARMLRSHGVVRDPAWCMPDSGACPLTSERGPWYYEMQELGYNYRLTDIQCALGRRQLSKLPAFASRRREIVAAYNAAFASHPLVTIPGLRNRCDAPQICWHLYTLQVDFMALRKSRTQVMDELRTLGVGTQVLYIPVHLQPWYRRSYGYAPGKCPQAEQFYGKALSLPLFPAMSDEDTARVVSAVLNTLR